MHIPIKSDEEIAIEVALEEASRSGEYFRSCDAKVYQLDEMKRDVLAGPDSDFDGLYHVFVLDVFSDVYSSSHYVIDVAEKKVVGTVNTDSGIL